MKRALAVTSLVTIVIVCASVIISSFVRVQNREETRSKQLGFRANIRSTQEVAMAPGTTFLANQANGAEALNEPKIEAVESGYHHVALEWTDDEPWTQPWLIQRSQNPEFLDPQQLEGNQATDNTDSETFRWLGINADNYVDLDGLEEDTDYFYRVASVTNMSEYRKTGSTPIFSPWKYGKVRTSILSKNQKRTYDVTSDKYGAVANDGLNDYPAVLAAYNDARKARGGVIYFPEGTFDLWPEHKDVKIKNDIPTVRSGKSVPGALFTITSDNITFLGEDDQNQVPTTFLKLYLWEKVPATKWLEVVNRKGEVEDVRRYHMFILQNVENFTLQNLDIDGGAKPVNSGKEWYSLDDKRYQWDISNKLIATWDNQQAKNVIIDNVDTRYWRGEVYYNGGGSQKVLLKDGSVSQTNSSTVSGSFDLELVNMTIRDSANSTVESALASNQTTPMSRTAYNQNHIARNCTFIGLDQSNQGEMKDLPGDKDAFNGWLVFNKKGTYQTITDSTFRDHVRAAYGPWYECRNAFLYSCTFHDSGPGSSNVFYTWTNEQKDYRLQGGFSEVLWFDNELVLTQSMPNSKTVFYSQPGSAAGGSESPWIWEGFHIKNASNEKLTINRFWVDTWWLPKGRELAVFEDFTKDDSISFGGDYLYNTKAEKIHPTYRNFFR